MASIGKLSGVKPFSIADQEDENLRNSSIVDVNVELKKQSSKLAQANATDLATFYSKLVEHVADQVDSETKDHFLAFGKEVFGRLNTLSNQIEGM